MASSNRHWPSLFKSKPCNARHQGHHDISSSTILSGACQKPPYTSGLAPGCEERSPEPKPRWNPKPEQIRILEAIFNSGMVNPPRDEIRRIRAQLQEYGQVGDANVFYWFQNRKSRSKQKQRHLQASRPQTRHASNNIPPPPAAPSATTSSSSSSSDRSTGSNKTMLPGTAAGVVDVSNSPTASVNQSFLHGELRAEPFYLQAPPHGCCGFSTAEFPGLVVPDQVMGLLAELQSQPGWKVGDDAVEIMKVHHSYGSAAAAAAAVATPAIANAATTTTTVTTHSELNSDSTVAGHIGGIIQGDGDVGRGGSLFNVAPQPRQDVCMAVKASRGARMGSGACGASRLTVFINEVAFEVGAGLLNVREAFGEEAVLLQPSGQPVPVDESGFTLHPLQHGASYYLV